MRLLAVGGLSPFWSTADQWAVLPPVLLARFLTALIGDDLAGHRGRHALYLDYVDGRGAAELGELPGIRRASTSSDDPLEE